MTCTCHVGPGRFEGEGPTTAVVHNWSMNGFDDHEPICFGDGSWAALITDTSGPWSDDDKAAARDAGFCDECIADAEISYHDAEAVTYGQLSTGALWSTYWADREKAQEAYDLDAADVAGAEEE